LRVAGKIVRGRGAEAKAIDLAAEVVRNEVAIDLRRDARVAVAEDPLHGAGFAPAIMSRLAVVCRKSWKRMRRTFALGQSFIRCVGQRRTWSSGARSE
jgi:hypothetical protein